VNLRPATAIAKPARTSTTPHIILFVLAIKSRGKKELFKDLMRKNPTAL